MPQVSRRVLSKDVQEKMAETLMEAVSQLRDKGDIKSFLEDWLSPVERIMVAKRLAIAILLLKDWDYPAIKDFLKVSNDTIAKVSVILKSRRGYKTTIEKLTRSEAGREFWREIAVFAQRFGVPGNTFADEGLLRHKLGIRKKKLL